MVGLLVGGGISSMLPAGRRFSPAGVGLVLGIVFDLDFQRLPLGTIYDNLLFSVVGLFLDCAVKWPERVRPARWVIVPL
jgi:hypothetical protein